MIADIGGEEYGPAACKIAEGNLFSGIERFGDATALICRDGTQVSFRQLAARADDAAQSMGEVRALVSVQMDNEIEPIAMYVGALRAGHVVIPHDGGEGARRISGVFNPNFEYARVRGSWELRRANKEKTRLAPDLAVLLSTSGSTGSPKLVRLSHQNLRSNAQSISDYLGFQPGERAITSLPAYYSYGLSVLHSHLLFGHTIILNDASVADPAFWETVSRERVTSIAGVPHTYELMEHSGFFERAYPDLRYMTQAGGKLAAAIIQRLSQWAEQSGKRFYVMYGQTEAAPRMAYLPPADAHAYADCIGVAIPGGKFRLEPLDDVRGMPEGAGELVYSGPNVMMGYATSREDLSRPQGPEEISTGDIAVCNDRGYYQIVGRRSRFAKVFGLRLSFDEIERRLASADMPGVVTGDDERIVIATPKAGWTSRIVSLLSEELGVPATVISVVEFDDIPRLATGKPDYLKIRELAAETAQLPQTSLGAQISIILGRSASDAGASFTELGGNSLTYVQMILAMEKFLGYVPANWENTPIRDLERLPRRVVAGGNDPAASNPPIALQGLDVARSIAIFLALLAHSFAQAAVIYPAEVYFLPRIATPLLIMLFGGMISLLYLPRTDQLGGGNNYQSYLTSAVQCYLLYALNVFVIWLADPSGWKYALRSLLFLGSMPYAQILVYYTIMFLSVPVLLFVLKRISFWTVFAVSLAVHAGFLLLKMIPAPPETFGVPALQLLMDLFVGAGTTPMIGGPSILHSFVFLMMGFWIGASIKNSSGNPRPQLSFIRSQLPIAGVFGVALIYAFAIPGYPVDWITLMSMELRNLNHPAYIFVYGAMAFGLLSFLLVFSGSARAPVWATALGRRSLFGFGVGNAIIVAWPPGGFGFVPPLIDGVVLLSLLVLMIYAFDYCLRFGQEGRGVAHWIFAATSWGSRKTQAFARFIVGHLRLGDRLHLS